MLLIKWGRHREDKQQKTTKKGFSKALKPLNTGRDERI